MTAPSAQQSWVVTLTFQDGVEAYRRTFSGRPSAARVRAQSFARSMEKDGWIVQVIAPESEAVNDRS